MVIMRNILIILILIALSACNSDKPKNDADINDKDSGVTDVDTPVPDPDTVEVDTEQPDIDADTDSDTTVPCLDLRYNENTIKTNFPFKDKNGKPTFCRPGCDTPTETDPQCVRNIWEWDNWEKYQKYLEAQKNNPAQTTIRECYPWPCKLPDMKADSTLESFNSKCDKWLTVNGFGANIGTIWTHGMSDGVAGMDLDSSARTLEYDPEKDIYSAIGQSNGLMGFNNSRFVMGVFDRHPDPKNNKEYNSYVISVLKKDNKYYYEFVYDNEKHNSYFITPPFVGKNWVLIQVKSGSNGSDGSVKYASAEDWQWHNIEGIQNYAGEGNIVSDHLTFITNNREIYYCDLRKYPKHINDCKKINRLNTDGTTYELGHSPRIDTENENRLVYNVYGENKFVEVILTDIDKPEYVEYEVTKHMETGIDWGPGTIRGDKMVYIETYVMSTGTADFFDCFYRFDKKKSYCPQENILTTSAQNLMGFNTFWGKWHLWKRIGRPTAVMRDWECYCKESGVCPFEE